MTVALRLVRPIGKRGQVVIPKDIRQHLRLQPGGAVAFEIRDGHVEIAAPAAQAFLDEFLSIPKSKRPSPTPAELKRHMMAEREKVR